WPARYRPRSTWRCCTTWPPDAEHAATGSAPSRYTGCAGTRRPGACGYPSDTADGDPASLEGVGGPAVDGDRRAGDELGRVGAQDRGEPAEAGGVAERPRRDTGGGAGQVVAVERRQPVGGVQPGLQRVDRHAVGCHLAGERLEE